MTATQISGVASGAPGRAACSQAAIVAETHMQVETPTGTSPLGTRSVGEAGTAGAPAAVMNAINDALIPSDALGRISENGRPAGGSVLRWSRGRAKRVSTRCPSVSDDMIGTDTNHIKHQ